MLVSILEAADITKHVLHFGLWTSDCLDLLQGPACHVGEIAYA